MSQESGNDSYISDWSEYERTGKAWERDYYYLWFWRRSLALLSSTSILRHLSHTYRFLAMSGAGSTNGSDPRVEPPAGKEEPKTEPQGESEHAHADTEGQQEGGVRPTAGAGASNKGLRSKLPSLLRFFSYPAGGSSGRIKRGRPIRVTYRSYITCTYVHR